MAEGDDVGLLADLERPTRGTDEDDEFEDRVDDLAEDEREELEEELVDQLRTDDEALLRFAYRWLRFALFSAPGGVPDFTLVLRALPIDPVSKVVGLVSTPEAREAQ